MKLNKINESRAEKISAKLAEKLHKKEVKEGVDLEGLTKKLAGRRLDKIRAEDVKE